MTRRVFWIVSRSLLLVLLGVSVATVVVAGRFWWQRTNRDSAGAATPSALKDEFNAYSERADELEKLLTLLLGISTIYAIALALSAYQQLKDSTDKIEAVSDKADREIRELPGKIESLRRDAKNEIKQQMEEAQREIEKFVMRVETKFPLLAEMDISIRAIMDQLIGLLPVIDSSEWSDAEYRRLAHERREEILFYEKTVAALVYFDLQRASHIRRTVSEIYHGLGNFYGLKYQWEGKQEDDKQRARFYLERAIRHDSENSGALNDRGYLAVYLDDPPDYTRAKALFSKSLEADPEQQRARYNLAYIEHAEGNYHRSQELLSDALLTSRWQNESPARNRNSILYNRACAYARLGELEKAVVDLEEVFGAGADYNAKERAELTGYFKQDIQAKGDLYLLLQSDTFSSRIELIATRLV